MNYLAGLQELSQRKSFVLELQERSRRALAGEVLPNLHVAMDFCKALGTASERTVIRNLQINNLSFNGCQLTNVQFESCTFNNLDLVNVRLDNHGPLMLNCNGSNIRSHVVHANNNATYYLLDSCFLVCIDMFNQRFATNSLLAYLRTDPYKSVDFTNTFIADISIAGLYDPSSFPPGWAPPPGVISGHSDAPGLSKIADIMMGHLQSTRAEQGGEATWYERIEKLLYSMWSTVFQAGGWNPALTVPGNPKKLDMKKFLRHGSDYLDGVLPEDIPAREDFIEAILSVFSQQLTIYDSYCLGESR